MPMYIQIFGILLLACGGVTVYSGAFSREKLAAMGLGIAISLFLGYDSFELNILLAGILGAISLIYVSHGLIKMRNNGKSFPTSIILMTFLSIGFFSCFVRSHLGLRKLATHCVGVAELLQEKALEIEDETKLNEFWNDQGPWLEAMEFSKSFQGIPFYCTRKMGGDLEISFQWFSIGGDAWWVYKRGEWSTGDQVMRGRYPKTWGPYWIFDNYQKALGKTPLYIGKSWLK